MKNLKSVPEFRSRNHGHMLFRLLSNPIELYREMSLANDDLCMIRLFHLRLILINHPDLLVEVLTSKQKHFKKERMMRLMSFMLGNGILLSDGDIHRVHRQVVKSGITNRHVSQYSVNIVNVTRNTIDGWSVGQIIDLEKEMTLLAIRIVVNTLFGKELNGLTDQLYEQIQITIDRFQRFKNPFAEYLEHLPVPGTLKQRRARRIVDGFVYEMIRERRESGLQPDDLLTTLLNSSSRNNDGFMTDEQIRDEIATMLFAGHSTTAILLFWVFWLLSEHPDVERRIHQEIEHVLNGQDRDPQFDDIMKLKYLNCVIKEALRMYPPVWAIAWESTCDVEIGEYFIPEKTVIIMSQFSMHRNPKYWDNPEIFNPDRFLSINPVTRNPAPGTYFPFSMGRRGCVGEHFALTEAILVIAVIARRWRLVPVYTDSEINTPVQSSADQNGEIIKNNGTPADNRTGHTHFNQPLPLAPTIVLRPGTVIRMRLEHRK